MICDPHFPCELWLLLITVRVKYILVSASESKSLYCPLVYGIKIRTSQEVPKIIPICTDCISYQTKDVYCTCRINSDFDDFLQKGTDSK